ncbi:3-hydroxyacyl-CoA dehydrogenase/enoyl-CoA hydratase family protein [Dethiobacter alkaliphilus]|uniref:3-hydroxyacyl-CoA dehydrogenase NAD-binding n=1 Tax=Dethiobacter alkaliphilus AHT 1 TaxID=555088 RepID=C0GKJ6_DETAL|nr:3-hydroxyacyl-CoA dehydrogenase/enoyl-CoA hydratase family protein [Dethiobacter alkaliphilus]EEG76163.1 3-hydroxyacyl-CoA dehydrogenase NAD-binding [Dethiobacter alkaliphilus AHT 1]
MRKIKSAAVLGAGTMGASIAAHLANVGIPCLVLDIVPPGLSEEEKKDPALRTQLARQGVENLKKMKPSPLYDVNDVSLLTPGNLEDDLSKISGVDWVIEVVAERMEIKKSLFAQVEKYWKPGTIVTTNTSGLSVNEMVSECSPDFRKHFFGTHFFNPPRYMKLLEVIPGEETDPALVEFMKDFGDRVLGKGVVLAKDTPNFIGNRIGVYGLLATVAAMKEEGFTPEEVDAVTGPAMGRPKSATFRTLDMVGLDIFLHVAQNVGEKVTEDWEKAAFEIPEFLQQMNEKRWLGAKTGQGFYKKEKNGKEKKILTLDLDTMEYREQKKAKFGSLEAAKNASSVPGRIKALLKADDKGSAFAWKALRDMMIYSAVKAEEIADDIVSVDRAMRWGFNWELGPFENWDAIGVKETAQRIEEDGKEVPALVKEMLAAGIDSFYKKEEGKTFFYDFKTKSYKELEVPFGTIFISDYKEKNGVIKSNTGASLIDIGDGVACLEIHSQRQALGPDVLSMMMKAADEVEKNWEGLVVASDTKNFCVGANLMMILMEAQAEEWDELHLAVRQFQQAMMSLKYCDKPVVAAPHGMALGGGYEILAHCDRIMPAAETYMGLVELGVGVIPAGGGTKEMVLRSSEAHMDNKDVDLTQMVISAFMTVAQAKVGTSAKEAQNLGYMRPTDQVVVNQDRRIFDAKQAVLGMARAGYKAPQTRKIRVIGENGLGTIKAGIFNMKEGRQISEYDAFLAEKLAYIMCGGNVDANTWVTEQYLLDLEREVFVELCMQPKTQQRMAHILKTGKPLRN